MRPELEHLVETRVKPLLEEAMHKSLGITIQELQSDISDRLKKSALLDIPIDTKIRFKEAKRRFKQRYIARLLKQNLGNIETVAKIASVDRRSIHRIVAQMKFDVEQLREQIDKKEYFENSKFSNAWKSGDFQCFKQAAVQDIIQGSLETYKSALHPKRYDALYREAPQLSKDILKELPEIPEALKVVETEFEKQFISRALSENEGNISKTARKIGLRFETLHRKMKKLGI